MQKTNLFTAGAILFYLLVMLVVSMIVMLIRNQTRSKSALAQGGTGWLEKVADQDDLNITALVYFPTPSPALSIRSQLSPSDPFLEVTIRFINASVFDLEIDRIDGRLKWNEHEFGQPIQLVSYQRVVKHGDEIQVLGKQSIQQTEWLLLKAAPGGRVTLDGSQLSLGFVYADRHGNKKSFSRVIPVPPVIGIPIP